MFDKPKYGWVHFELERFSASISYLTDVPLDILDACIAYKKSGSGSVCFDCEGWMFTIVFTPYQIFIIEEKDETKLWEFFNTTPNEFVKEIISDIESNKKEWLEFLTDYEDNNKENEAKIDKKLKELKQLMKRE